ISASTALTSEELPVITLRAMTVCALTTFLSSQCIAAGTPPEAVVYIKVGAQFPTGEKRELSKASGFLVTEDGIVVTARHALDVTIPADAKLYIEGAWGSKDNPAHPLYSYDILPSNVDITTLRFSPALAPAL